MESYLLTLKESWRFKHQRKTEGTAIYWYNGNLIQANTLELAIDDPGLLYGATVFTTLRIYHQSLDSPLTNWEGHCDRLFTTLQTFDWQQPEWNRLRQGAEALMQQFPVLRLTIFPDGREWIVGRFLPNNLTERQHHGIAASIISGRQFQRCLPAYKTGNYLSAWLARATAQQMSAQEAILVDESGSWLETTTGNLWGWQDGSWWTPPLTAGILPGVVRSQLINWLRSHDQQVKEEPWGREIVQGFEAIAYSNSVVEVIPIHTVIEGRGVRDEGRRRASGFSESGTRGEGRGVIQLKYDPYHSSLQQVRNSFLT